MESVLDLTLKEIAFASVNQKLILQGIGWAFYEDLLKEYEDSNGLHFAYDNGSLEVEVPTTKHERPNRILQTLSENVCLKLGKEFYNAGSTTFRKGHVRQLVFTYYFVQFAEEVLVETTEVLPLQHGLEVEAEILQCGILELSH